jgi:hypothetical protein
VDFLTDKEDPNHKLSDMIEVIIPCLSKEMFTLKKNYTIALQVANPFGKWPEQLGNSFFIDS